MERTDQGLLAPWVVPGEGLGIPFIVGHVATPAARNPHLAQHVASLFQDQRAATAVLGMGDGPEETGRPSTDHDGIP